MLSMPNAVTESEQYLYGLSRRTFLSLWSYPNVYRDQPIGAANREGKEICDLLVVFDDTIIIFSDKYCEYPNTGDRELDWKRWYKRAVQSSSKQLDGAERWIRIHPDRVFADKACTQRIPLRGEKFKIHRIIVAHGASLRCRSEMGGSGSLILRYDEETRSLAENGEIPDIFEIGPVGSNDCVVHVLDDFTLKAVLSRLDTISDFVRYLEKKEKLLRSGIDVLALGEEEMLAYYLKNMNENQEHDFALDDRVQAVLFEDGIWFDFESGPQRSRQIQADQRSYLWDRIIERLAEDTRLAFEFAGHRINPEDSEEILRILASESRFRRRQLANALGDVIRNRHAGTDRMGRLIISSKSDDRPYLFMGLEHPSFVDYDTYRSVRMEMLVLYCESVWLRYPEVREIVGIATELGPSNTRTFDVTVVDLGSLREQDRDRVETNSRDLKLLRGVRERRVTDNEYPDEPLARIQKGRHRNSQCPCGSHRKYKHCCGRAKASDIGKLIAMDGIPNRNEKPLT
jgi:hypothetical protein